MSEQLMLDVDQASEMKAAFRRSRGIDGSRWTNHLIKRLTQGDILGSVLDVLEERAQIMLNPALELTDITRIPARYSNFVAGENFVRDHSSKALVRINNIGQSFREQFLQKVEKPRNESYLRYHRLKLSVQMPVIIAELGGEQKASTSLGEIFTLLQRQGHGESGPLLTDRANIFFVVDIHDQVDLVAVAWDGLIGISVALLRCAFSLIVESSLPCLQPNSRALSSLQMLSRISADFREGFYFTKKIPLSPSFRKGETRFVLA